MRSVPHVGAVILNWNSYEDTYECAQSVLNCAYSNKSIYIIDNGSSDDSGQRLDENFSKVDVVFNDENLGFSGGCNIGIEKAKKDGCEHILLLNNDIVVTEEFLSPLVKTVEARPNTACVGGIIYQDTTSKIWDAGGKMIPRRASKVRYHQIQDKTTYETEFVTCAMNLLSRDFLQNHRLDEGYFFGMEEVDLSWRAIEEGWELYTNPDSIVQHKVGNSTDPNASETEFLTKFQYYHKTRGHLRMVHKNFGKKRTFLFYICNILFYAPLYGIHRIIRGRSDITYTYILAIIDHYLDRSHKKPGYFGID